LFCILAYKSEPVSRSAECLTINPTTSQTPSIFIESTSSNHDPSLATVPLYLNASTMDSDYLVTSDGIHNTSIAVCVYAAFYYILAILL